jgi:acyl carrier protein
LTDAIRDQLRDFIVAELLPEGSPPDQIQDDTPLLASGSIDSLGLEQLLYFIEDTYGLTLEDEELHPEDFETVATVARFVGQRIEHQRT